MGIRDLLAEHDDCRFISLSDLINIVAEAEGVSIKEVARAFSAHRILTKSNIKLRDYDTNAISDGGFDSAFHELQGAISNTHINASAAVLAESRHAEAGFLRIEIAEVLQECGIAIPSCLLSGRRSSLWKSVYAVREWIDVRAAASILTDNEPGAPYSENHHAFSHWLGALEDAADSLLIKTKTQASNINSRALSHADIRRWCSRNGFHWPLPTPAALLPEQPNESAPPSFSLAERDALIEEISTLKMERDEIECRARETEEKYWNEYKIRELEQDEKNRLTAEVKHLQTELARRPAGSSVTIKGNIFAKLVEVIEAFPGTYPDPAKAKLDEDIRPWIKDLTGLALREAHVFGSILKEHFRLKG